MKTRLISSAGGLVVLAVAIIFYDTLLLNLMICVVAGLAVWELLSSDEVSKQPFITAVCIICTAVIIFGETGIVEKLFAPLSYACVLCVCLYGVFRHRDTSFVRLFCALTYTVCVAVSFKTIVLIRDGAGAQTGLYYLLLALGSAWLSDSGAYFAGTFFGKHKMCPEISPKKTWEGLAGGLVVAIAGNLVVALIFRAVTSSMAPSGYISGGADIQLLRVVLLSLPLSLLGVLGDLTASQIKRQSGIKDFGSIMPGHGGVMDRFDSVLLILPAVYIIFKSMPLISIA